MDYIDGFVAAVPTVNRQGYIDHARMAGEVFKEHGAKRLVECWGNDILQGKVTSFPMAVQCKDDETVVFSWVVWPSREVRDQGWKKIMEDPRMNLEANPMPFDGQRMIHGGFDVILDL